MLGFALLIALWSLWRQNGQARKLKKEAQSWEEKYSELMTAQSREIENEERLHQLHDGTITELDGQPRLPHQLEGWSPDEIGGASINEATNRPASMRQS